MGYDASVHAKAIELIKLCVEMTTAADSGHVTTAASLAHLVTVLLYDDMRYDPHDPAAAAADRLVLSEGHACPIIYAAGADLGFPIGSDPAHRHPMTRADALTLRAIDSPIDGHPNPAEGFPFFPAATGSLGQGLSVAAGMALAARMDGLNKRIYCLIGDGESREGQVWEAADFVVDYHLLEVCPIFNCNTYGQADHVSSQESPDTLAAKLQAYGFEVRILDGHAPTQIKEALEHHALVCRDLHDRPFAIVARTVKGWGIESVTGANFHGKPIPAAEEAQALAALDAKGRAVGAHWTPGELRIPPPPESSLAARPQGVRSAPSFHEALERSGKKKLLAKGEIAPRRAFGVALQALGHVNPYVAVLDADVRNSTYTEFFLDDPVLRGRFIECRIAEQNMISVAVGLASGGKIPFASTFGKFLVRGYDQLEMGFIGRFPLKLVGTHVGVSLAADGPSQMALADVAFFRAWAEAHTRPGHPVVYLLNPADAYSAYALTVAMASYDGACYLRAFRPDVPFLYDEHTAFPLGGHHVLSRGRDLLVLATGYMVHEAKKALALLQPQGVSATLADLYSLPFDAEAVVQLAREHGGRVLTVEDNFGSGFGSAVADALAAAGGSFTLRQMYVRRIPKSGRTPDDVLHYLGLSAEDIARTVRAEFGPGR